MAVQSLAEIGQSREADCLRLACLEDGQVSLSDSDWFTVNVPALFTLDIASTSQWFGMTVTDPVNEIRMLGLLVAILFVYDLAFMYFAFASVFVCFIMYICKFNYEMIKIRRMQNEE